MNLAEAKAAVGLSSPVFDAPPVVETSLGLYFAPIEGFSVIHFGQLLNVYEKKYDRFELKPPVGSSVQLTIGAEAADINIPLRCWFISPDGTQVVQIQRDLFIRNWRATAERKEYQHYQTIQPLFRRDWDTFCNFLDVHHLKRPSVWQCEVTYINHLVRGREWNAFDDIPALFPIWRGCELGGVFNSIEMVAMTVIFGLPNGKGRIQFTLQPGVLRDGREILQLTVTAQGKPEGDDAAALLDWLDYGHLAVVNGFVQFTSEHAHKIWGKK